MTSIMTKSRLQWVFTQYQKYIISIPKIPSINGLKYLSSTLPILNLSIFISHINVCLLDFFI